MATHRPRIEEHPLLQSDSLTQYLANRLRTVSIDLHSAFQLHHEAVRIRRFGYRQRAWSHTLITSELYALFMHCLTARALGCVEEMQMAERWFLEDALLLRETRRHHFADRLPQAHALLYDKEFL